jgi:hypothetical protein
MNELRCSLIRNAVIKQKVPVVKDAQSVKRCLMQGSDRTRYIQLVDILQDISMILTRGLFKSHALTRKPFKQIYLHSTLIYNRRDLRLLWCGVQVGGKVESQPFMSLEPSRKYNNRKYNKLAIADFFAHQHELQGS